MKRYVLGIGLSIGAVFGMAGSFVQPGPVQNVLWEISSLGLIFGSVMQAARSARLGEDEVAVGFALLATAEAVMSGGTAAGISGGQSAFAAGTGLYVPALLFISLPRTYAIWVRVFGILSAIPFAVTSFKIFAGGEVLPAASLPGIGYGLMTIAIVGWVLKSIRKT